MADGHGLVADIAMVAGVGAVTALVARRLGQPPILGYLVAGLIVGPSVPLPLFADPGRVHALAELGVVLVMFAVGLEFQVARLMRVLPRSGFTALVQMGALAWAGFAVGAAMGWTPLASTFLAASLAISSTMVVSGLFALQPPDPAVREHVLGVLVVQDVAAIVLLATLTGAAQGHALEPAALGALLTKLLGVLTAMLLVGAAVVPRSVGAVLRMGGPEVAAVTAMGVAFTFAALAEAAGFSVALGAFVAGMLVAESGLGAEVEHIIAPLRSVFAAVFFVSIGMSVDPLASWTTLPLALCLSAVVVGVQLGSVMVGSLLSGIGLRSALVSGLALGQIGELSFIIAEIGRPVVPGTLLATLVTVATVTSFTTPAMLARAEGLVGAVDRALPRRVRQLLSVHEAWLARTRGAADPRSRAALRAFVADGVGLVGLAAAALVVRAPVAVLLQEQLGLSAAVATLLEGCVAMAVALPLVAGLIQNTRLLADAAITAAAPSSLGARRALTAMVHLALGVGLGVPALGVLRPLVGGPWAEALIAGLVVGAVVVVHRNLSALEREYRSGVEEIVLGLGLGAARPPVEASSALLAGLDGAVAVALVVGARAIDRSLAELDLRARTGATVIAIRRGSEEAVLPNGQARLAVGDVVVLAGPHEATVAGRALLLGDAVAGA